MKYKKTSFQKKLMPLMVSLITAGSSSIVFAQTDAVEEIVVSGYRESLAKALDIKRKDTTQVDAIVAEDIGKFPDSNLAESMQRIPGIAIDREGGEGRQISVRGLGSDFTRVRLNGLEALSTSGQGSSGPNRSRGFDFNTFASELFSQVKVSKTQNAAMDEGSLGSTVDLRGGRPFDYKGFKALASIQEGYNELSGSTDPRFSGLISNINEDGTLGGLFSASYSKRTIVEEGFNPVRFDWGNGSGTSSNVNTLGTVKTDSKGVVTTDPNHMYGFCTPLGYTGAQVPRNPLKAETPTSTTNNGYGSFGIDAKNCATGVPRAANTPENITAYETATNSWHPRYPGYRRNEQEISRLGLTGSIQWKPSDSTLVSFDALYSGYEKTSREDTLGLNLHRNTNLGGKSQIVVKKAEKDSLNRLTYAELDNVDLRSESAVIEENTSFGQYTLNVAHDFNDDLHLDVLVGTSHSRFTSPVNSLVSLDNTNIDGVVWDARKSFKTPKINYGVDLTSNTSWDWLGYGKVPVNTSGSAKGTNISEIRLNPNYVTNGFDTAKVDLSYQLNDAVKLSGGIAYKDYLMDSQEFRHVSYGMVAQALPAGVAVSDLTQTLTGYGDGLNGAAPKAWLQPNFDKFAELLGIYDNKDTGTPGGNYTLASVGHSGASGKNYSVEEEVQSAYFQADFVVPFLNHDLRGNIGTRYTKTNISASGWSTCPQVAAVAASGSTPATSAITAGNANCTGSTEFYGVEKTGGTPGPRYYVPIESTNEYDDWLPSLNLAWDVADDVVVRFAAARTMARPNLTYLQPNISGVPTTFGTEEQLYSINAGNPKVDPYRADTFDLAAEWYFEEGALLSGAIFYKDIKSYIQQVQLVQTWDQTGWSTDLLPAGFSGDESFNTKTYSNTPGGPLKGYELNYQQPFSFLPGVWSHFGFSANFTHVESTIDYVESSKINSDRSATVTYKTNNLVNMSPKSYNATFYYDDGTFSARISAAYRDAYLTAILNPDIAPDLAGNILYTDDVQGKHATTNVDFNMSYKFTKQLSMTFEATNLTDQFDDRYADSELELPARYSHTGRQFAVGARYKF